MELQYDDNLDDAMGKVNAALESHGLQFVDDGQEHDGFMIYTLEKTPASDSSPVSFALEDVNDIMEGLGNGNAEQLLLDMATGNLVANGPYLAAVLRGLLLLREREQEYAREQREKAMVRCFIALMLFVVAVLLATAIPWIREI